MFRQPRATAEGTPRDRGDVHRASALEHDPCQVAAVELRALGDLDRAAAEERVRRAVLNDCRHAADTRVADLGLETGWPDEVTPVECPDARPGVVPLAEARLQ